jgi:hypothetical protein
MKLVSTVITTILQLRHPQEILNGSSCHLDMEEVEGDHKIEVGDIYERERHNCEMSMFPNVYLCDLMSL